MSNTNHSWEATVFRKALMEVVTTATCPPEEIIQELAAALACYVSWSGEWEEAQLLREVSVLFRLTEEIDQLQELNPFVNIESPTADA